MHAIPNQRQPRLNLTLAPLPAALFCAVPFPFSPAPAPRHVPRTVVAPPALSQSVSSAFVVAGRRLITNAQYR